MDGDGLRASYWMLLSDKMRKLGKLKTGVRSWWMVKLSELDKGTLIATESHVSQF
jgi:hypothetical protein